MDVDIDEELKHASTVIGMAIGRPALAKCSRIKLIKSPVGKTGDKLKQIRSGGHSVRCGMADDFTVARDLGQPGGTGGNAAIDGDKVIESKVGTDEEIQLGRRIDRSEPCVTARITTVTTISIIITVITIRVVGPIIARASTTVRSTTGTTRSVFVTTRRGGGRGTGRLTSIVSLQVAIVHGCSSGRDGSGHLDATRATGGIGENKAPMVGGGHATGGQELAIVTAGATGERSRSRSVAQWRSSAIRMSNVGRPKTTARGTTTGETTTGETTARKHLGSVLGAFRGATLGSGLRAVRRIFG